MRPQRALAICVFPPLRSCVPARRVAQFPSCSNAAELIEHFDLPQRPGRCKAAPGNPARSFENALAVVNLESPLRDLSRQTVLQTWLQKVALGGAVMGEMKRAIAREQTALSQNMQGENRMKSTLVIAAAIIAAVRLARDADISRPSPRLTAVVNESVRLARMILDRVGGQ